MFGSRSKRRTRDGTPIYYVFVDESGHPFYDEDDVGPFTIGGIITDDPDSCSKSVIARMPRKGSYDGAKEMKSSRTGPSRQTRFIELLKRDGRMIIVTSQPIYSPAENPIEYGAVVYAGTLSRLLNRIADEGPPGIYRIYVDDSEYIDESMLRTIAEAAFNGVEGKTLATYKSIQKSDSEFMYPVQAADMVVGGYRKALKRGESEEYTKQHGIIVRNRRRRV